MTNYTVEIVLDEIRAGVTDQQAALTLRQVFPKSFQQSQSVLVATSKMIKGAGWFTSERARTQRTQRAIYDLEKTLNSEGFTAHPTALKIAGLKEGFLEREASLFVFLNMLAQAYPNWRREYSKLNSFIPLLY